MDVLTRIKQLILRRQVEFTLKAREEMESDGLTVDEVYESIVNARSIHKILRSRSRHRRHSGEKLYVIKSRSYGGSLIYTKGTIASEPDREVFYIFVSAKLSTISDE